MIRNPTYQAATTVAPAVEEHFIRHLAQARERGEDGLAPHPDAESIAAIIDATFWASFRPEEGRFPKISLAYLSPEQAVQPLMFASPLPLNAGVLTKLAPAVERPEIHLGFWRFDNELRVWGAGAFRVRQAQVGEPAQTLRRGVCAVPAPRRTPGRVPGSDLR